MFRILITNKINSQNFSPARYLLWLSLLIIQLIGLIMVICIIPFVFNYIQKTISPSLYLDQNLSQILSVSSLIFCICLALGNGLAMYGIFHLKRWPLYFLTVKLAIDIFIIFAVFFLGIGRGHLFFVIPLFCSLCYMVVVYHHLTRKGSVSGT